MNTLRCQAAASRNAATQPGKPWRRAQRHSATTTNVSGTAVARPHAPRAILAAREDARHPQCHAVVVSGPSQATLQQPLDAERNLIPWGLLFQHCRQGLRHVLSLERASAREHLVQHTAERPDVAALVHACPRLLGTHVGSGAEQHPTPVIIAGDVMVGDAVASTRAQPSVRAPSPARSRAPSPCRPAAP